MYQAANANSNKTKSPSSSIPAQSTRSAQPDDASSMVSKSSTSSTTALLKEKFHKITNRDQNQQLSPGEKQAARKAGNVSYTTLGTMAALK